MDKTGRARIYDKHLVKRSSGGIGAPLEHEDGTPQLGDCVKTNVVITPQKAAELNADWANKELPITYYYKEREVKPEKEEKPEARLALEKEATELGVKFRDNIGNEKLKQKIEEEKAK